MMPTVEDIEELFKVPLDEGENKVTTLKDAVSNNLKPGCFFHLSAAANLPYAFTYEITRQFWGSDARFKVSALGASSNVMIPLSSSLIHENTRIIDELITTYVGDIYPAPSPSRIFAPFFKENKIRIQNWSLLSMVCRFFAGALNLPFIPINTINDTNIALDNGADVAQIENPFSSSLNEKVTVLKPLNPDVAFLHGVWADKFGNTLLLPPYTGYMWEALAAKKIIVSVEKIVPTEIIRKYNYFSRIPGHRVAAVVEAPFGAHPSSNRGIPGEDLGYTEDYDFIVGWRKATKSEDGSFNELKEWITDWVLSVDHQRYLKKIGNEHLSYLSQVRSHPEFWRKQIKDAVKNEKIDFSAPATPNEIMAIMMADLGLRKILKNGYKTILAGQGVSNLASWLCHKKLLEGKHHVELMAELGFYGYYPRPSSPFIFDFGNLTVSKALNGVFETLGYNIQGFMSQNIGFLGAGQIDKKGNINSTKAGNMFIVGSGGAADVCGCSKEVIICLNQDPMRMIEQVPYITGSGKNVTALVTEFGIFEKIDGELALTTIYKMNLEEPDEKLIKKIKRSTGWKLDTAEKVEIVASVNPNDLMILRCYDINRNFLGK